MTPRRRMFWQCAAFGVVILAFTVFRPVRAHSVQTLRRAPLAIRDVCQPSLGLEGCHVEQALSHEGQLYFLATGSRQKQPFSAIVKTSEDGGNPTVTSLGQQDVISFALDSRGRLAYLASHGSRMTSDATIHLLDEKGIDTYSHTVPRVGRSSLSLIASGTGIVGYGFGRILPFFFDGRFAGATQISTPAPLGPLVHAARLGNEQLALVSMTTGATQLYSGNAFVGPESTPDFQQIPFADIQAYLSSARQPGRVRGLVAGVSSDEGSLFLLFGGFQIDLGAVVVETVALEPGTIARVYRLELGTSDRLKDPQNPTGLIYPLYVIATANNLILGDKNSGTFAVYKRH